METNEKEYIQQINEEIYLIAQQRGVTEFNANVTEEQIKMNNYWAKPIYQQNPYKLKFIPYATNNVDFKPTPLYTSMSPSEKDSSLVGTIEEKEVIEILKTPQTKTENSVDQTLNSIPISISNEFHFQEFPNNILDPTDGYLCLSLGKFESTSNFNGGFFQLFCTKSNKTLTEPVYFRISESYALFTQTVSETVAFPIKNKDPNIVLICFLYFNQVPEVRVPLVCTIIKLYNENGELIYNPKENLQWNSIDNFNYDNLSSLMQNNTSKQTEVIKTFQIHLQHFNQLDREFSYSWSKQQSSNFRATALPNYMLSFSPLILIENIQLTMKIPKNYKFVFLTVTFVDDYKAFTTASDKPCFIGYNSFGLSNSFTTMSIPKSKLQTFTFIDTFSLYIDRSINVNSYFCFQINGIDKNNNVSTIGISIRPLFENNDISNRIFKCKIFNPKKISKDFLKLSIKKDNAKRYLQCNIKYPSMYFPPSILNNLIQAYLPEQVLIPLTNEIPIDIYQKQIIPITAKLLLLLSTNTLINLMQLFDIFNYKNVSITLRFWIYHIMDPTLFDEDFINKLCKTIIELIKNFSNLNNEEEMKTYLRQISYLLPILFDILIVFTSMPNIKYKKLTLIKMIQNVSLIISKYRTRTIYEQKTNNKKQSFTEKTDDELYNHIKSLNKSYSNFIFLLTPKILTFEDVSKIIFKHLNLLMQIKKRSTKRPQITYLQFSFLLPFTQNQFFFGNLALLINGKINNQISPYNPILSQIYITFYQALLSKDKEHEKSIEISCDFFLSLIKMFQNSPNFIIKRLTYILYPLINLISIYYDKSFNENRKLQIKIIPVIFFILTKSDSNDILNFYKSIGNSYQLQYLNLFQSMITTIVTELNEIKPTYESPNLILNFYDSFTYNLINILTIWSDYFNDNINVIVNILKLIYNEYQSDKNILLFYKFCVKIINNYSCNRELISWVLSLFTFKQHKTRCLATALLITIFKSDYDQTKTVITSTVGTMDSLTSMLLNLDIEIIPIYNILLDRIVNIITNLYKQKFPNFYKLLFERMEATKVIYEVVEKQKKSILPPEIKCQQIMRIADQYQTIPSMRLKWLLQIVKINKSFGFYISAFVSQLHVVTLISYVIQETFNIKTNINNNINFYQSIVQPMKISKQFQLQTKNDFNFMPDLLNETKVNFQSLNNESSKVLLNDFTFELLLNEINAAIELGKKSMLFYSLRPLYSLQIRIYESLRNYEKMSNVMKDFSQSLGNIQTKKSSSIECPILFYYVENNSNKNTKQIFTISKYVINNTSTDNNILTILNDSNRFDNNIKVKICNDHSSNCKDNVCVIRVIPIEENTNSNSQEFSHCWKRFRTIPNINKDNTKNGKVSYLEIIAHDYLPHYRVAADVDSIRKVEISLKEYITNIFDVSLNWISQIAEEFEIWFPMNPNINKQYNSSEFFAKDLGRISDAIAIITKGNESISYLLEILNGIDEKTTKRMTKVLMKALERCVMVLRRALKEIGTNNRTVVQLLNVCEILVNEFAEKFGLDKLQQKEYVYMRGDPMDDGIEYEFE